MKSMKLIWTGLLLAACILSGFFAVPAQARDVSDNTGVKESHNQTGQLHVSLQGIGKASAPTTIVVYNDQGVTIEEVTTRGGGYQFTGLKAGEYHVVAFLDDLPNEANADAKVESAKISKVSLDLKTAPVTVASAGALQSAGGCGCNSVASGDGSQVKISGGFGAEVIYLQCGHVVATYGSSFGSCGCSNNYRYTTNCTKSKPIYVNLPCPRRRP